MPVSSSHTKVLSLTYVALMAALMAVCAWITIPVGPVPFTMQTFAVFAALGLLGGKRGALAVVVYLLLGLVGLPVFAGFSSGAAALLGALTLCVFPYILPDLGKIALALVLTRRVGKYVRG